MLSKSNISHRDDDAAIYATSQQIPVGRSSLSIKDRFVRALAWSGADVLLRQGLQFFVSVLLARLLTPEDFGTVALLYLFIGVASMFIDSGFSSALVQRQDTTHDDESTVFWFSLVAGAVAAIVLCAASPFIATFYEMPLLRPLTCAMALNLFISAFGSVHTALLTKALDFQTQMKISVVSSSLSGVAAVALAWRGAGVWSLVTQVLLSTAITVGLLWYWHAWRPARRFSMQSLRSLWRFGGFMLLSGLLDTVFGRLHTLVIGKLYSPRDLGFYNRAAGTQQLPANVLTGVLNRVVFPVFSAAAADKELLRRGVRKVLIGMMMLNIPMMLGMMVTAEPLVITLFGDKWRSCVPVLQVLCLAGVLWPLHVINLNVLMAQGHSNLFFRIEVAKKVLGVAALAAASPFGVVAIAWSQVGLGVACFLLNAYYTGVLLGYTALQQARDFMPYLAVSVFMAGVVWVISSGLPMTPGVLLLQVAVGASVYLVACKLLRLVAYEEAWAIVGPMLQRQRPALSHH